MGWRVGRSQSRTGVGVRGLVGRWRGFVAWCGGCAGSGVCVGWCLGRVVRCDCVVRGGGMSLLAMVSVMVRCVHGGVVVRSGIFEHPQGGVRKWADFSPPPLGSPCRQGEPSLSGSRSRGRAKPAGRGNRTSARFPSRSGGNLQEGGKNGIFEHPQGGRLNAVGFSTGLALQCGDTPADNAL
jgi:hypothetical protein